MFFESKNQPLRIDTRGKGKALLFQIINQINCNF